MATFSAMFHLKKGYQAMRNTFKILFYVKRSSPLRNGELPIMCRITINGRRVQLSTQLSVQEQRWDVRAGRIAGRSAQAERINERLAAIRHGIERSYHTLAGEQLYVTPQRVKEIYLGLDHRNERLLDFFRRHNAEFRRMVGLNRSMTTYYKYRCVCIHLENFIHDKYNRRDLLFKELDTEFLTGFHAYISHECSFKKNTTWIYMIALKHILMLARSRGYMACDLFAGYKLRSEFVMRNYLTMQEIDNLIRLDIERPTAALVRDAFLFSCFTGLSYVDLCALTPENVRQERNRFWISTTRRKTGSEVDVRLFALPYAILCRYMPRRRDAPIFDLPGNGWCNVCLRRIAEQAGIAKRVTFHTARHTFATTVTLSQGVAIETISKLLGHKNIRTTQIYATVTHARLDLELERLSRRIDPLCRGCLRAAGGQNG